MIDLQDTDWITRFEASQKVYIDTTEHLRGFPMKYVEVTWHSLIDLTMQCCADGNVDHDSQCAASESSLCSYIYTKTPLDDDAVDCWREYVVSDFLRYGTMQLWVTP